MLCARRCGAIAADRIGSVLPSWIDKKKRDISFVETAMAQRSHRCLRLSRLLEASCNLSCRGALLDDCGGGWYPSSGMNNVMLRTFVVVNARITWAPVNPSASGV